MEKRPLYVPPYAPDKSSERLPFSGGNGGVYEAAMATALFIKNFRMMKRAGYKGGDKYYHCKANAQATQLRPVAEATAKIISWDREVHDPAMNWFKGEENDSEADRFANQFGRDLGRSYPHTDAVKLCEPLRPVALPPKYW